MQLFAYVFIMNVAIIGASGYSGAELIRLLARRSDVQIQTLVSSTTAGKRLDDVYPEFAGQTDLRFTALEGTSFKNIDLAFTALPSGESMKIVPKIHDEVPRVIDLSGDYRLLSSAEYAAYYHQEHVSPSLLSKAVYGLPEIHHDAIANTSLVANPGCYPTSAILALIPALRHGIIEPAGISITSLSGTSGAGRSSSLEMSFTEVHDNIRAYKLGAHQHIPEIQHVLSAASGKSVTVSFVPHLVPMNRGIYTTIHSSLAQSISREEVFRLYKSYYREARFVRVKEQVAQLRDVIRTNYCDISLHVDERTNQLILLSTIDNLVKGAAGQAVQNMNIMLGLPEDCGLS